MENGFILTTKRENCSGQEGQTRIAEAKVDAMAQYYGWESDSVIKVTKPLTKSDGGV